jgi:hypothetical protein
MTTARDKAMEAMGRMAYVFTLTGREVDALRAEAALAAAEHVTLQRISGILCDAGDVVVEPYPEAVAEVVRQRDEARALLREARQYTYMASSGGSDLNDRIDAALSRVRATLKHDCDAWKGSLRCAACAAGLPPEPKPEWYQRLIRNLQRLRKGKSK